jgi:uncharacterized membrane protein
MLLHVLLYGLLGLLVEVIYTAVYAAAESVVDRIAVDPRFRGHTYLWMAPIYGFGGIVFEQLFAAIIDWHWLIRMGVYAVLITVVEYICGYIIEKMTGSIPWDYSKRRWHIHGKIRLDYLPVWACFGLFLEVAMVWVHAAASGLMG